MQVLKGRRINLAMWELMPRLFNIILRLIRGVCNLNNIGVLSIPYKTFALSRKRKRRPMFGIIKVAR